MMNIIEKIVADFSAKHFEILVQNICLGKKNSYNSIKVKYSQSQIFIMNILMKYCFLHIIYNGINCAR
ncbi:hypothetical protein CR203_21050 [Salipaludibacillus neizhouensis]|uniref:Uncharacterized protein n=1 Tax=Salipaludibacillus neizhouensis TaxID=885475 RepID=A0A3A9JWL5_9BACI|nr:hypothetical protein CR203_21050 [Salipaludibacillus neizhouensis]